MKKGTLAVLTAMAGGAIGTVATGMLKGKSINYKQGKIDKFKSYYNLLNQWLMIKQEGKSLEQYFLDNEYQSIAIYGMGELGNRLYDELKGSSVQIKYAIDKNADSTYAEIEVKELEDTLEKVDAVIVTAIFAFDEIEDELSEIIDFPIVSLEDVVYEI